MASTELGAPTVDSESLAGEWELVWCEPGALRPPTDQWVPIVGATTVAHAIRCLPVVAMPALPVGTLDEHDFWYGVSVGACPSAENGERLMLCFDGVATRCTVYIDGSPVAQNDSMFVPFEIDVTGLVRRGSRVEILCSSLHAWLHGTKRGRPRWRTKLVADQHLRFARTSLLGRIPSWGPDAPAIGPWRPVRIETRRATVACTTMRSWCDGNDGVVEVVARAELVHGAVTGAMLRVGPFAEPFTVLADGTLKGRTTVRSADRWWPVTHGRPALYDVAIELHTDDGRVLVHDLGRTGFRTVRVDRDADGHGFGLVVNDVAVFVRGACWMPLDPVSLQSPDSDVRAVLARMASAGLNIVRLSGTTVYASDAFHRACDELGMLVWQDLMFANLDVPFDEVSLRPLIEKEIDHALGSKRLSPSLVVVCGSSELEQQAAMVGCPPETWETSPLRGWVATHVADVVPDAVYVSSSPTGGHLPFVVDQGVGHYYGVGAYLRPLNDARHARPRFAAECLAFSNIGDREAVARVMGNGGSSPTDPRWKAGVPRDAGAGWDFEDVRDHYVEQLFGVDPAAVRYADPARYLSLGRVATGEVIRRTIEEWRHPRSTCRGAIVWFLNDIRSGAGWGVLDDRARPKPAFHLMAQACRPLALLAIDEGVNGLDLCACNDSGVTFDGELEVMAVRHGRTVTMSGSRRLSVGAHQTVTVRADEVLGRFSDPTYAYRFGPPAHDAIIAVWRDDQAGPLAKAFHFPLGLGYALERPAFGLQVESEWETGRTLRVTVSSESLVRFVSLDVGDAQVDDNYFHIEPAGSHTVRCRFPGAAPTRGYVSALDLSGELSFVLSTQTSGGS